MSEHGAKKSGRHLTLVVNNDTPVEKQAEPLVDTLDSKVLLSIRALSKPKEKDYLTEVIDRFSTTTPELLSKLERAILEGNGPAVVALAQYLKGAAFSLGALELARLAQKVEACGMENNLKSALMLFPEVSAGFEQTKNLLQTNWRLVG